MAIDPICGMTVDETSALSVERDGKKVYFCSDGCREKFLAQAAEATPEESPSDDHDSHSPAPASGSPAAKPIYTCPMHPEVEEDQPGACPICGMALELKTGEADTVAVGNKAEPEAVPCEACEFHPSAAGSKPIYTCPMHPEVAEDKPGACPKCGMALELKAGSGGSADEENAELRDMTRRFWIGGALALPVFLLAMSHLLPGVGSHSWVAGSVSRWLQFGLTTPVVFWAGWPFFQRGWRSLVTRHLNMFTLISMGVSAAYLFSAVGMLLPDLFPATMQHGGKIDIYFEASAVIIVLVLLGQVLELRARSRTGSAIKVLAESGAAHRPPGRARGRQRSPPRTGAGRRLVAGGPRRQGTGGRRGG